jgi:hypothetical protein
MIHEMQKYFILPDLDYGRNLQEIVKGCSKIKYGDLVSSDIALRHNIANIPTEEQWIFLENLSSKIIDPIFKHYNSIIIKSVFRTPVLSAIMGSSTSSNHCKGQAIDFLIEDESLIDVFKYICKNFVFHEMIAEYFPHGWIHISYRENSYAKTLKLHDKSHKNLKINLDYISNLYKNT